MRLEEATTKTLDVTKLAALLLPTIITPDFGTVTLTQPLLDRWNADAKGIVGWPIANSFAIPGGGEAIYCESGMIVIPRNGKATIVYGRIYLRYRDLGDVFGWMGLPLGDEGPATNGRVSHFTNCDIYWNGATDAHEVHGAIRDRYNALGGPGGFLGYPLTDETPVMNGTTEVGRYNRFQGGVIEWSGASGAWEVHGAIRDEWENAHKGAIGELGFPISNETRTASDSYRYSDFQNGTILYHTADGVISVFTKLDFFLDGFNSKGSDGFLRGGQDVYVKCDVRASSGEGFTKRMPDSGDFGSSKNIAQVMFTVGAMRGGTTVHVHLDGWDADWPDSDDELGNLDRTYSIENLWGINEDVSHWVGDFEARYKLRQIVNFDHSKFRENYYWKFHNFDTAELSWGQFAETFSDVSNDESVVWHPFDHLFYTTMYKGIAADGNCFGMCWESLFAQVGHSIYREPIALVAPTNGHKPDLTANHETVDDINIKHGYQISGQMVDYVAPLFLTGGTHDPKRAFADSRNQWNQGDYPVLAITEASLGGGGHVIRPYAWDDSVKPWRIYVCDPNQPLVSGPDPRNTFVEIDPDHNTFSFRMADGKVWSGGTWSGGRCYSIPFHVVCHQPRTPFWEALALLVGGGLLLLAGDATTQQIRDSGGRTFYKDGLPNGPQNWEDLQPDATRTPGVARVPLLQHLSASLDARLTQNVHLGDLLALNRRPELYYATHARPKPGSLQQKVGGTNVHLSTLATASGAVLTDDSMAALQLGILHSFATGAPLPSGALEATIASRSGAYTWAVRTPVSSHIVNVPAGAAASDSLLLENMGHAQQAVTYAPSRDAAVGMIVVGGKPAAGASGSFGVGNLRLRAGQKLRAHIDPETSGLVVENTGDATSLDMTISIGPGASPAATRTGVPIAANSVTRFAPVSWTPASVATGKVKMETLAPTTGAPTATLEI